MWFLYYCVAVVIVLKTVKGNSCYLVPGKLHLPSAFVLCELKFNKSKQRVEPKLDQSEVPAKRLESIHRKYQLLRKKNRLKI